MTTVIAGVTVSAVTPNQGTTGTTVPVTIDGSGFVRMMEPLWTQDPVLLVLGLVGALVL